MRRGKRKNLQPVTWPKVGEPWNAGQLRKLGDALCREAREAFRKAIGPRVDPPAPLRPSAEVADAFRNAALPAGAFAPEPPSMPEDFYWSALKKARNPDHAAGMRLVGMACSAYGKALELQPGSVELLRSLGAAHRLARRTSSAIHYFEEAAKAAPQASTQLALGILHLKAEQYAQALAAFEAVLASRPGCVKAISGKGSALSFLDRPVEAADAFRMAAQMRPGSVKHMCNHAYQSVNAGRAMEALAGFADLLKRRLCGLHEETEGKWMSRMETAANAGFYERMGGDVDEDVKALLREDPLARFYQVGFMFMETGHPDVAVRIFDALAKVDDDFALSYALNPLLTDEGGMGSSCRVIEPGSGMDEWCKSIEQQIAQASQAAV